MWRWLRATPSWGRCRPGSGAHLATQLREDEDRTVIEEGRIATTVASALAANPAKKSAAPPWEELGFRSLETEIAEARALEVRGTMPKELSGVLYRIGPARHDVYGERLRSWFDGDGMVHALAIEGGRVTYRNRFVATLGKLAEDRVSKRLYGAFDTSAPGGPVARFLHRNLRKNPANTSVVFHAGKLLALCESGRPYRLDPETLATMGEDDMSGALAPDAAYHAHPKLDPETGEMWIRRELRQGSAAPRILYDEGG